MTVTSLKPYAIISDPCCCGLWLYLTGCGSGRPLVFGMLCEDSMGLQQWAVVQRLLKKKKKRNNNAKDSLQSLFAVSLHRQQTGECPSIARYLRWDELCILKCKEAYQKDAVIESLLLLTRIGALEVPEPWIGQTNVHITSLITHQWRIIGSLRHT